MNEAVKERVLKDEFEADYQRYHDDFIHDGKDRINELRRKGKI